MSVVDLGDGKGLKRKCYEQVLIIGTKKKNKGVKTEEKVKVFVKF